MGFKDEYAGDPDYDDLDDDSPGFPSDDDDEALEYPEPEDGPGDVDEFSNEDSQYDQDEDDEDLDYPAKTFDDGTEEEKPEPEKPEEKKEPRKKGNVHAENRILRRENRNRERENNDLRRKLDLILERLNSQDEEPPEPEDIIPGEDEDPLAHTAAVSRKVLSKLEEREKAERAAAERDAFLREIQGSDAAIAQFANADVGIDEYNNAIAYLAKFEVNEMMEDDPNITEQEAVRAVAERAIERKVRWARAGINPGEQFYNKAVRSGYKRKASAPDAPKKTVQRDPKAEIRKANARDQASRTISSANGASPKRRATTDDISKMSDNDLENYLDGLAGSRTARRSRNVKISDILPPTYR